MQKPKTHKWSKTNDFTTQVCSQCGCTRKTEQRQSDKTFYTTYFLNGIKTLKSPLCQRPLKQPTSPTTSTSTSREPS